MKFKDLLPAAFLLFIPVASAFADTEPGITRTEPLPGNNSIFRMAGGGSVLVTDGARTRLADGTWIDNCYSFGVFDFEDGVFHGWRRNENFKFVIQTSPDGVTWTDVGSGKEFDGINTATYDNGKYLVAYSSFNRDQVIVSNDNGVTWTETNGVFAAAGIELSNTFVSGYGFGRWFLRAGGQSVVGFLSSTDGISWSEAAVPVGTPTQAYRDSGIAFGGGVGLVSVGNSLLKTTDGTTWTEVKRFSNGLVVNGIAYNDGKFLLARTDFSQKFILESSSDLGATFSIIPNVHQNRLSFIQNQRQVKAVVPWKTGFAVAGENGFVLGTEDVTLGEPSFQRLTDASLYHFNNYPFQMVVNGGTLARFFTGGTPRSVQTSTDGGFTWSTPVTNLGETGTASPQLVTAGGAYFLRDFEKTTFSADTLTWTKAVSTDKNPQQFNSDLKALSIVHDGTKWVALIREVFDSSLLFRKYISTSTDGVNWTKTGTLPPSADSGATGDRLVHIGGEFFQISTVASQIEIHRSPDLVNWSLLLPPFAGNRPEDVSLYRDAGLWLINGAGAPKISNDGVAFYDVPSLNTMALSNVFKFNGKYYGNGQTKLLVSDDLHSWKVADGNYYPLQSFLTGNANGLLLYDRFRNPRYLTELPVPAAPGSYTGPAIAISPSANGKIRISIPTEQGKFYYIQTNPRLDLPLWDYDFTNLPFVTGDGTVQDIEFTPAQPSGFFRLEAF